MPPFFYCLKRTKKGLNRDFYWYRGAFDWSVKLKAKRGVFYGNTKRIQKLLNKEDGWHIPSVTRMLPSVTRNHFSVTFW